MLILATAFYLKVMLSSRAEGEVPAVGMWFVAICMDLALATLALVVFSG